MRLVIKIIIIAAVLSFAGFLLYKGMMRWHKAEMENALDQEQKHWKIKSNDFSEKISSLEEKLKLYREPLVTNEKLKEVFGEKPAVRINARTEEVNKEPAANFEQQILAFFKYLDKQGYTAENKLPGGAYYQFRYSMEKLSEKPPRVTDEMRDLFSLMLNVAHFNRTLGPQRIIFFKDIVRNESAILEPAMASFFAWFTADPGNREKLEGCPSMEILYEYSAFFLKTLAGRSYLLRRNSKIRTLSTYYCVLILHIANERKMNSNGLDIRPHLELSLSDCKNQKGLAYRENYIARLEKLKEKYGDQ